MCVCISINVYVLAVPVFVEEVRIATCSTVLYIQEIFGRNKLLRLLKYPIIHSSIFAVYNVPYSAIFRQESIDGFDA